MNLKTPSNHGCMLACLLQSASASGCSNPIRLNTKTSRDMAGRREGRKGPRNVHLAQAGETKASVIIIGDKRLDRRPSPTQCRSSIRCPASPNQSCATPSAVGRHHRRRHHHVRCHPVVVARPGRTVYTGTAVGAEGRRKAHPASVAVFRHAPGRRRGELSAPGRAGRCSPAATATGRSLSASAEDGWGSRVGRRRPR